MMMVKAPVSAKAPANANAQNTSRIVLIIDEHTTTIEQTGNIANDSGNVMSLLREHREIETIYQRIKALFKRESLKTYAKYNS